MRTDFKKIYPPEQKVQAAIGFHFYLRLSEVCSLYGVGSTWVYEKIKEGKFPKPRKFGAVSRWAAVDLLQWEVDNGWRDQEQEAATNNG